MTKPKFRKKRKTPGILRFSQRNPDIEAKSLHITGQTYSRGAGGKMPKKKNIDFIGTKHKQNRKLLHTSNKRGYRDGFRKGNRWGFIAGLKKKARRKK